MSVSATDPCIAGTHAFYDLFRMEGGMIVEHWDVIQPVPTEGLANTNGMFTGFDAN